MNLGERVRRLVCPGCIEDMASHADRRSRTVSLLERSGERLDRLADEVDAIRRRMADDRSPFLGDRREGGMR